jgi:predicted RecB family nuclease
MFFTIDDRRSPLPGQATEFVRLSKSRFVAGVQCLRRLYLQTYAPDSPIGVDARLQGQLDQGQRVGELAQTVFPGGVVVASNHLAMNSALAETAALMDNPAVPAIFEAAFRFEGIVVRVDILERRPGNEWRLIEVKSSTSCKDHYLYDIAIQRHVLSGCGLTVSASCLMHLNRDYVYNGVYHDAAKLFTLVDLSSEISALEGEVREMLYAQRLTLSRDEPPEVAPGGQCVAPYRCEFFAACNPPLPENHISTLPHLSAKKTGVLAGANISLIPDIPADFALSELQRRVCVTVETGRPWFSEQLASELSILEYPLYFMDFETIFPAIPRHAGMWPYSHIPFQWSVHRQETPDATVEHFEFLAEDENDPRSDFFESLSRVMGRSGHIVAYNASFEAQRLEDLAGWFPEYRVRVDEMKERVWDLLPFVRRNVYHPDFCGSFSLKSVLPALLPELTYEGMEVGKGEEAGLAWERMLRGDISSDEKAGLKSALLAYCQEDTWALVALLKFIRDKRSVEHTSFCAPVERN